MQRRWRDQIVLKRAASIEKDAWGCIISSTHEELGTYWADVTPILGVHRSAMVIIKVPFPQEKVDQVIWNDRVWKITHPVVFNQCTGIGQFKMEEVE